MAGDVRLMRDEDDRVARPMKALEYAHNLNACLRIEIAGWFVSKQNRRTVHERTCNRDALALSP